MEKEGQVPDTTDIKFEDLDEKKVPAEDKGIKQEPIDLDLEEKKSSATQTEADAMKLEIEELKQWKSMMIKYANSLREENIRLRIKDKTKDKYSQAPIIIRRVHHRDGTVTTRKVISPPMTSTTSAPTKQNIESFVRTWNGQAWTPPVLHPPPLKLPLPVVPTNVNVVQKHPQTQQMVQFVRGPDGQIVLNGLLPGQELVQMPDGKFQITSKPMGFLNPVVMAHQN